jgi:hypothetical protein
VQKLLPAVHKRCNVLSHPVTSKVSPVMVTRELLHRSDWLNSADEPCWGSFARLFCSDVLFPAGLSTSFSVSVFITRMYRYRYVHTEMIQKQVKYYSCIDPTLKCYLLHSSKKQTKYDANNKKEVRY